MKSLRRGKRRNTDLTVRDILLETIPWAVPEEGAGVGLSSMSLDEELLYEPNKVIEQMIEPLLDELLKFRRS